MTPPTAGAGPAAPAPVPKQRRFAAVAALIGVALMCALWLALDMSARRILADEASERSRAWASHIRNEMTGLDELLAGWPLSEEDRALLFGASRAGNVFRYRFVMTNGTIAFSSNVDEIGRRAPRLDEMKRLARGGEVARIVEAVSTRNGERRVYGEARVPIEREYGFAGVVKTMVDVTALDATNGYKTRIAKLAGFIVIAVFGAALIMVYRRYVDGQLRLLHSVRASEEKHRTLFEAMPYASVVCVGLRIAYANKAALAALGYDGLDDILGRSVLDIVDSSERERVMRNRDVNIRNGIANDAAQFLMLRKDGGNFMANPSPRRSSGTARRASSSRSRTRPSGSRWNVRCAARKSSTAPSWS